MPIRINSYSLKTFLRALPITRRQELKELHKQKVILHRSELDAYLMDALPVVLEHVIDNPYVGLVKDLDYLNSPDFIPVRADWPKYERFLKFNNIHYSFYDVRSSQWMMDAMKYDVIIWHPYSSPVSREEAENKLYVLQNLLHKKCYPTFEEMWGYENKIRSYYLNSFYGLPVLPTFLTNSKNEALDFVNKSEYPLISKISTGSASNGVFKIANKKSGLKFVKACFSSRGRATYWPYLRQKNYLYLQRFINDAKYDLRIIVVGNKVFGYFRYAKKNDFRASGSGILEKKELPRDAMLLAIEAKRKYNTACLAVDLLYSERVKEYYIIETSIFFGIDTPEQLLVKGKPGYYEYKDGKFDFREGRYWIQELVLKEYFDSFYLSRK
ncbi:MAG: hypothetical protein WAW07_10945 [Bacteroidales bacterium]